MKIKKLGILMALSLLLVGCFALEAAALPVSVPSRRRQVQEKKELNSDTVGWIKVPGTNIDDVAVQYTGDQNQYYLRRNFEERYDFEGCYFADYRCDFTGGTSDKLSRNTIIYAHSFSEDPNGEKMDQLKRYYDEDFAREYPYIYFYTAEQTMVWKVFAVSVMTVDVPYNRPDLTDAELDNAIAKVRASSVHSYDDISVKTEDRILTLSTMDYSKSASYPSEYRFVVMAKLVGTSKTAEEELI